MDPERERIQADLRGLVKGDVRCDDVFLQLYASDASIYEIRPLAVVRPRSLADVVAAVEYAAENHLPIHPRGAGTGLAGESLGAGLVLDFSRYMRRLLDDHGDSVRIQPGIVHAQLNELLRPSGRHFGPDPAMASVTTMGSVIAIDAGGSHWLKLRLGPRARAAACKSCWPTARCWKSAANRSTSCAERTGFAPRTAGRRRWPTLSAAMPN